MKIIVLKNKINFQIEDDCQKVVEYFKPYINLEFSFKEVNIPLGIKPYKQFQGFDPNTGQPRLLSYYGLIDSVKDTCRNYVKDGEADFVIFTYDQDTVTAPSDGVITSFAHFLPLFSKCEFIQLATNNYLDQRNKIWEAIIHEVVHALCFKANRYGFPTLDEMDIDHLNRAFYKNDFPNDPDSNFGFTLKNLQPFFNSLKNTYTYFSLKEVNKWKLRPELWVKLDKAREIAGIPFIINSGLRTEEKNEDVGGVIDSSHLNGLGVDIKALNSNQHYLITKGLYGAGFRRISKKYPLHIHVDISQDKPQDVLF